MFKLMWCLSTNHNVIHEVMDFVLVLPVIYQMRNTLLKLFVGNVMNVSCGTYSYCTGNCFLHAAGTLWPQWQCLVLHQPPQYFLLHTVSLV
jgi:hypothetical protein